MIDALVLESTGETVQATVRALRIEDLPQQPVRIQVLYSSINYKDALAVTGRGKVIRAPYPFVPGIDLAGRVVESHTPDFAPGDLVIQTGGGLGEKAWGGYSQEQRVSPQWLLPLPEGLTPLRSMVIGTAGLTAMLSVIALEAQGLTPDSGEVIVTGASGGVGSFAVAILACQGYTVAASTGSNAAHQYLRDLGAAQIRDRAELAGGPKRPLEAGQWAGAIDTVGGATLAAILTRLDRRGSVAACGNAGGIRFETTVFPFILRGVSLLGIDSNTAPMPLRQKAWERLSDERLQDVTDRILSGILALDALPGAAQRMMAGSVTGRLVVDVQSVRGAGT